MNIYPTLVIGIGGSGKLVCKFLKKNFAERFPKNWLNPATGLPHIISIIVIETEPGKEKEEMALPSLPDVPIIAAYVDEPTLKAMQTKEFRNKNPEINSWLFSGLPLKEIIGGAGQIRQAGRLAFFRHRTAYGKIQRVITSAIENIRSDEAISSTTQLSEGRIQVPHRTPRCYIISSVCGGTGSGMLLDIAGIVNNAGARANLIAFLPKMFESVIDLPESVWQTYSNTYATLKEINHYMTNGRWKVWYNEKTKDGVELDKKIFEYCFLVDKESENLDLQDRLHVSPLVGEFLFWMISELEHPLHTSAVNIQKFTEAETSNWCNGLGIACLSFPLEEIREIMTNWAIREIITKHLSVDFAASEIENIISDPNTGYLFSDFYYKSWEDTLLGKKEYFPLSAETIIKRKGALDSKIRDEKNRLKREHDGDLIRIKKSFDSYVEIIKKRFIEVTDEILVTKGLEFFNVFIEKFKTELHRVKTLLVNDQQAMSENAYQISDNLENSIKLLTKISEKRWFADIGWSKRVHPHVENILKIIKNLYDLLLKIEKHKYALKIVAELEGLIEQKKDELLSLSRKLETIRINKEVEENKLWSILAFGSDAQIKVKSSRQDIEIFYKQYIKNSLVDIGKDLMRRLINWRKNSVEEIFKEIETAINDRMTLSGFNKMTIIDAMKNDMHILGNMIQDCITNKSSPFIRHAGSPTEERFFIHAFEPHDIRQLPPLPADVRSINSYIESDKRRMIFIRLSANFSLSDLAPYDFADKYAKAYEDSLKKNHKWIHIQPEALGFEDPLNLSIGMEEESLLRTSQDVGIVFQQKSYHFEYKENKKTTVIAQGLENSIRKLQDDPNLAKLLKKKLIDFFNNQTKEWLIDYINDHDSSRFPDEKRFRENHEKKYKNNIPGFSYGIGPHRIPSYIIEEINKRISKK